MTTKKGCYFVVFFIDELFSHSYVATTLTDFQYYLTIAVIYSLAYWLLIYKDIREKTTVWYVILISFYLWMSIDAITSNSDKASIYIYYASIVMFIHVSIITSLVNWRLLRKHLGAAINGLLAFLGINNSMSLFYIYTDKPATQKTK